MLLTEHAPTHPPVTTNTAALTLDCLPMGVPFRVTRVGVPGVLGDRLVELGFTAGAPIQLLRRAPFGGPLQVQVRDFVLSLRRADARAILADRVWSAP